MRVVGCLLAGPLRLEPRLGSMLVSMIEALDERGRLLGDRRLLRPRPIRRGRPEAAEKSRSAATCAVDGGGVQDLLWVKYGAAVDPKTLGARDGDRRHSDGLEEGAGRRLAATWRRSGCSPRTECQGPQGHRPAHGTPARALRRGGWEGYLAVAHTRMATESAVTVLHSHPFVPSRDSVSCTTAPSPTTPPSDATDAAGVRFDSDNDSEVAARYLAQRSGEGTTSRRPPAGS